MLKLIHIDTETTGTNPTRHAVIQLAGVIEMIREPGRGEGEVVEEFDIHMAPHAEAEIDPGALEVCGVTVDEIRAYQSPASGLSEFKRVLGRYVDKFNKRDKFFFCAYNGNFDFNMIHALFQRGGDSYCGSWFWYPPMDVAVLAGKHFMDRRASLPNFKLSTVAGALGLLTGREKLHYALEDVLLSRAVYHAVTKTVAPVEA